MSDYLAHYGVLGMKWGVRKDKIKSAFKRKRDVVRARMDARTQYDNRYKFKNGAYGKLQESRLKEKIKQRSEESEDYAAAYKEAHTMLNDGFQWYRDFHSSFVGLVAATVVINNKDQIRRVISSCANTVLKKR